jgi:outer membrane protein TolC
MKKPMIGAGLQYMALVKRDDDFIPPNTGRDMIMPMVSMTVPIWNKKYSAALEESQIMERMYGEMKKEMENELASMYEMTKYEMDKMILMNDLITTQMSKTQQAIDLVIAGYSNDGADFEEVLRLQMQLYRYKMQKVILRKEYILAQTKLDYLTGQEDKIQ